METRSTAQGNQHQVLEAINALKESLDTLHEEHTRHREEHREAFAELRREVAARLQTDSEPEASPLLSGSQSVMPALPSSGEATGTMPDDSSGSRTSPIDHVGDHAVVTDPLSSQQRTSSEGASQQQELQGQIAPKMIVKLDTYDGRNPWGTFRTHFDLVADINGWKNNSRGAFLASALRGAALEVLQNLPATIQRDYNSLVNALEGRFGDKHLGRLYHATLRTRVQQKNESLAELATDIERLARHAYEGCAASTLDLVAAGHFVDAISDSEVQQFVRLSSPGCMRDAVARAMEVEAARGAVRATRRVSAAVEFPPAPPSRQPALRHECKTSVAPARRRSPPTCWSCGRQGHLQRYCNWHGTETRLQGSEDSMTEN